MIKEDILRYPVYFQMQFILKMRVHSALSSLTQIDILIASQTHLKLQLYRAPPDTLTQLHLSYVGHCKIH